MPRLHFTVCFTVTFLPVKAETRLKIKIDLRIVFRFSHMYSESMVYIFDISINNPWDNVATLFLN